jgi:hypothetical protein
MDEPPRQKRRIIVADDEEEEEEDVGDIDNRSTGSNPDVEIDETVNDLEDDDGEDLAENWIELVNTDACFQSDSSRSFKLSYNFIYPTFQRLCSRSRTRLL